VREFDSSHSLVGQEFRIAARVMLEFKVGSSGMVQGVDRQYVTRPRRWRGERFRDGGGGAHFFLV
jgi:hypothetical protein